MLQQVDAVDIPVLERNVIQADPVGDQQLTDYFQIFFDNLIQQPSSAQNAVLVYQYIRHHNMF